MRQADDREWEVMRDAMKRTTALVFRPPTLKERLARLMEDVLEVASLLVFCMAIGAGIAAGMAMVLALVKAAGFEG